MPLYRYKALNDLGKSIKGVIEADSFAVAKERLRKEQIVVVSLDAEKEKEHRLSSAQLLSFTRELTQLLKAGLPLYESLLTIEEKYRGNRAHPLFLDLCDHLKSGKSLSAALKKYPKTFDNIYISLVKTAEKTGNLPAVFERLTILISQQQKLRKELVSAFSYPAFLLLFCSFVLVTLFFFVVPSMEELFSGRELHPITAAVLSLSRFLRAHGLLFLTTLLTLAAATFVLLRSPNGRHFLQKLSFKLPIIKSVIQRSALARFCSAFSALLSGGVPIVESLTLSRAAMNNALLSAAIERTEVHVAQGKHLSACFQEETHIPPLVSRMAAIAEQTGEMPSMMGSVAAIYEEELERDLKQIVSLLQPLLLLVLGLIVGLVLLSILIPLTDVSSFIT
ncbi:MAG: type II secretion system F family protein [Verrucomicrobia bacterium]|nr:type II secretion system F family protein [Verrucomicrobiota bacterium]